MKVEWAPFGEICTASSSSTDVAPDAAYPMMGVRSFGRGSFASELLSGGETSYSTLKKTETNQIVYPKLMAWEGAFDVVPADLAGRFVSPEFILLDVDSKRASPEYVRNYLHSSKFGSLVQSQSRGTNVRRRRLRQSEFLSLRVPLPSLVDQTRIAEHLTLLQSPLSSEPPRGLALPDGKRIRVGDLVQARVRAIPVVHDETYPMFGVKWYGEGAFIREVLPGAEISAANVRRIESGDLIYNRLFAWKQSFALAARDGYSSNEFPAFEVDVSQVSPRVLLALLTTDDFTEQVNAASTGSTPTSRNRLKEKLFLNLTVDLPSKSAQPAIERALFAMDKAKKLHSRRDQLAAAVLPAARNEIFTAMR